MDFRPEGTAIISDIDPIVSQVTSARYEVMSVKLLICLFLDWSCAQRRVEIVAGENAQISFGISHESINFVKINNTQTELVRW